MKKAVILLLLFLLAFSASAQVSYEVDTGINRTMVNASIILSCSESSQRCPVNSWRLTWKVPEGAEIINVSDSQGEIEDYTRNGNNLQIQTNSGPARKSEKIQILMNINEDPAKVVEGLYTRKISLAGIPGEVTTGVVENKNILSASVSSNFEKSFTDTSMKFKGEGGVSIRLNFGKGDKEEDYMFFGGQAENSSLAYRVSVGTTGLRQNYPFIPVAVLSDEKYNAQSFRWSQGEYSAGIIRLRESEDNLSPVLAEETVHAFNSEALSFDKTSSSYLDEGIAGHIQSLVRKKLIGEERMRELFGEELSYTKRVNGSLYRFTKPSKGNKEELWKYYKENMSFMKSWSPHSSQNRDFGYAYSELIVKNYIANNNSLNELYSSLRVEKLEGNKEKWVYYSQYMDLTPCNYGSRERFERCLDKVNSYSYPIYYAKKLPAKDSSNIKIQKLEVPNYTSKNDFKNTQLFQKGIISSLIKFLESLWAGL